MLLLLSSELSLVAPSIEVVPPWRLIWLPDVVTGAISSALRDSSVLPPTASGAGATSGGNGASTTGPTGACVCVSLTLTRFQPLPELGCCS